MKYRTRAYAAALLAVFSSSAFAQSAPLVQVTNPSINTDPIVAYNAYNEAVNAGKLADAARFATEAWQLGEAKWGSNSANTAGLAFNAAWSAALVGKSVERMDAARRAVELAPIATSSYSAQEAQFLLAYAEFFAADTNGRQAAARKLSAAALPVEGTWNDYLIINALVTSANLGSGRNYGRETIAIADRALAAIDRLSPNDTENRALAYLARAQGRLTAGIDREEALADVIQARVAYGPMRGVDDTSWGVLAAWEIAINSVLITTANIEMTTGTRVAPRSSRSLQMTPEQGKRVNFSPNDELTNPVECTGIVRIKRIGDEVIYPPSAINDYRVAGVLLRVNLNPDGSVVAPRLLGAVPAGAFADNAVRAISTWRYTIPANTPAACLKDKDVGVSFVIY
jgi:hypothetical protein